MATRQATFTSKINYLRLEDLEKFEDIRVVSEDGKLFDINSAVLASISSLPLLIHPTEEKMSTIVTDIHSTHLEVIFSFIFTGFIPFTEISNELYKSFSAMRIDLPKVCLKVEKTRKDETTHFAKPMRRKLKVRLNKLDRSAYFPSKNLENESLAKKPKLDLKTIKLVKMAHPSFPPGSILIVKPINPVQPNQGKVEEKKVSRRPNVVVHKQVESKPAGEDIVPDDYIEDEPEEVDDNIEDEPEEVVTKSELAQCAACGYNVWTTPLDRLSAKEQLKKHKDRLGPYHDDTCVYENCGFGFNTWEEHCDHVKNAHGGTRKYKCGFCKKTFDWPDQAQKHKREEHHKEICRKTCIKCGMTPSNLKQHMEDHHGTEQIPCPVKGCKSIFKHPASLMRHRQSSHQNAVCNECGKIFSRRAKLNKHMISSHTADADMPFRCEHCNKGFAEKWLMTNHVNQVHLKLRPEQCSICGRRFPDMQRLKTHEAVVHSTDKIPCPVEGCKKVFNHQIRLKDHHDRVHAPKSRELCNICGKTLADGTNLRSHIQSYHTADEDKPFHCETCGKGFHRQPLLKMHVDAVHLKLKPYPCRYCDSAFAGLSARILHEKHQHLGIKRIRNDYAKRKKKQPPQL